MSQGLTDELNIVSWTRGVQLRINHNICSSFQQFIICRIQLLFWSPWEPLVMGGQKGAHTGMYKRTTSTDLQI